MCTELARFTLHTGADLGDPNSSISKTISSLFDTVAAQDGFQRIYWGPQVENPATLVLMIGKTNMLSAFCPAIPTFLHEK